MSAVNKKRPRGNNDADIVCLEVHGSLHEILLASKFDSWLFR